MRVLDPKCASPTSSDSRRTVVQLAEQSAAFKVAFFMHSTCWDLGNLVRCALEAKISPDVKTDDEGARPMLMVAAQYGSIRALKALLAGGANTEAKAKGDFTALSYATRFGHLTCVQLLLEAGANANTQDWLGNTPLHEAIICKQSVCAQALLPFSDLCLTSRQGQTAFHISILTASEECFEILLPHVTDVDIRTSPGIDERGQPTPAYNQTALHIASEKGQQPMAKALLQRGASRMARASNQRIPLHLAALSGQLSCVLLLVGRPGKVLMTPAEVNAVDVYGCMPIHFSAQFGNEKICGVLLQAGARLDAMASGCTPLEVAQQCHPTNAALLAVLSGAGPTNLPGTVCDHCGKTAEQASVKLLKVCGNCHSVRFCNAACQTAAWPGHKAACKARVAQREEKTRVTMVAIAPPASRP